MSIEPLAIYGAIVATTVLCWNIIRDRPRVIVNVGPALEGNEDHKGFSVAVINRGYRPVNLVHIGLVLSGGFKYGFDAASHNLPILLPQQDRYTTFLEVDELREIRQKLKGFSERGIIEPRGSVIKFIYVEDATGKIRKGKIPWYIKKIINI